MPLTPHVIDTKKIPSMPFSGIQGIGENFNVIQGINSNPRPTVEFEIVRYQFMKVNGSGATKINVVGKYFFRLTNVKMFQFPSNYSFKLIACFESILKFRR